MWDVFAVPKDESPQKFEANKNFLPKFSLTA
jgi:hypothetical protein